MILFLLFFISPFCLCEESAPANKRNPKLFWVSTESSTSTVVTSSFCYMTAGTLTACGKRRKKRFLNAEEEIDIDSEINPDRPIYYDNYPDDSEELTSGYDPKKMSAEMRDGRLLLYWMTTTSVLTTHSYTSVLTVASITCTPNDYDMDYCGTVGKK